MLLSWLLLSIVAPPTIIAVDGGWGPWHYVQHCKKCGTDRGYEARARLCNNPAPFKGGKDCVGKAEDYKKCRSLPCPRDGGWGPWKHVQSCKTCGADRGYEGRVRKCNNPTPAYGGKNCVGKAEDYTKCKKYLCPLPKKTKAVCEWRTMKISCPYDMKIEIHYALYGRIGRKYCDDWFKQAFWNKNCRAGSSLSVVKKLCQGRRSCSVPAKNSVFGDPCAHTEKYLEVTFRCVGV